MGHGSGINLGDVDSKPGKLVSQKLFTFEEKAPHAIHFAACFGGAFKILIE